MLDSEKLILNLQMRALIAALHLEGVLSMNDFADEFEEQALAAAVNGQAPAAITAMLGSELQLLRLQAEQLGAFRSRLRRRPLPPAS